MKTLLLTAYLLRLTGGSQPARTELLIYNPYSILLKLQVKCDHDHRTNKWRYYNEITIPKRSHTRLIVPNDLKQCQIWPLDFKLF